jgi:hypothetical protein
MVRGAAGTGEGVLAGLCFASATSSCRLLAGTEGWTASPYSELASFEIGAKSLIGSNGTFLCVEGTMVVVENRLTRL